MLPNNVHTDRVEIRVIMQKQLPPIPHLILYRLSCGANKRYILFKGTSSRTTNAAKAHHHVYRTRTLLPRTYIHRKRDDQQQR